MAYINGVIHDIREVDIDDGLYIGEFVDELGEDVVLSIINSFDSLSVDFGGGVKDVPLSTVLKEYGNNHYGLAKFSGIKRSEAKNVLEICKKYEDSTIAYG